MALDVGAGDEVVTTPFTFFATAGAIARTGARPVFADIEPRTYNVDPARVEAASPAHARHHARAPLRPVRRHGRVMRASPRARPPRHRRRRAGHRRGRRRGRRAGSIGASRLLQLLPDQEPRRGGRGGIVTTNDDALAERLRRLRVHGGATEYHHDEVGFNSRLDTLQAAVLRVKLPHLDAWSDARRERAAVYTRMLATRDSRQSVDAAARRTTARATSSTSTSSAWPRRAATRWSSI